jgi:hypothetical protein
MNENKLIDDKDFFVIHGWMVNKLDLRGCEKEVFAVVFGYCKSRETENSFFYGTLRYLQEFTGYGRSTVIDALKSLCGKEFIIKHSETKNNVLFNKYSLNRKVIDMYLSSTGELKTNRFNHKLPVPKQEKMGGTETERGGGTVSVPNNIDINNIDNNLINIKENKNKEIFNEDLELEFDLASEPNLEDSFLLRDDKLVEPKISIGEETELGANSPEFAYAIKDENGKVVKHSNNPYKILPKEEADLTKGFISDLINDYYPIDEMYLPIQDNAANERFRAKYPPLYPEFGNHMNIYQSCLRDYPKNEAKAQVLFEQLYPEKIDWSKVRSKQGMLPMKKEDIDKDFLANMDYSTSATLMYFGIKYEKTGPNKERPIMKYKEVWVPIYPYSYLEKQAPTRLRAFLNTASNVPSYYQILVDLIKDKEKK